MRSLAALAGVALLAACGSSKPSHGLVAAPSITVAGTAYAPGDAGGLAVDNTPCNVGPATLQVSALVAGFSSYDAVCDYVKANTVCANKPNSWRGSIAIIKGGSSLPPGPIGTGVYTITTGPPMPDQYGNLTVVNVAFEQRNATCQNTASSYTSTGTVTIDQVAPTVKGSIDATIMDGAAAVGTISGPFEVGNCAAAVDICGQLAGTCINTCI
jgi:hypothetical protein